MPISLRPTSRSTEHCPATARAYARVVPSFEYLRENAGEVPNAITRMRLRGAVLVERAGEVLRDFLRTAPLDLIALQHEHDVTVLEQRD